MIEKYATFDSKTTCFTLRDNTPLCKTKACEHRKPLFL